MIKLIAGAAVVPFRQSLAAQAESGHMLCVVPDAETGHALAAELAGSGKAAPSIIEFPTFLECLSNASAAAGNAVSYSLLRAAVRSIIVEGGDDFNFIVGRFSVPRLTSGVLDLVCRALDSLANQVDSGEEPVDDTPRRAQLKLLASRLEERLGANGLVRESIAQKQLLTGLDASTFAACFPGVRHVVFLDFLDIQETVFLAVAAVARLVDEVDVLLEFDPEGSAAPSHFDRAYQVFFDMADQYLLSAEDLDAGGATVMDSAPVSVINAPSLLDETRAATAVVRQLLDSADGGDPPTITIALADWNDYAPVMERLFREFRIDATWAESASIQRGGEFTLLSRLADCTAGRVTGKSISALLRAPGFASLFPGDFIGEEGWNLAARLDYLLAFTGQLTGWKEIRRQVASVLERIQSDRQRQGQWTEEEAALDEKLMAVVEAVYELSGRFSGKKSIREWSDQALEIVGRFVHILGDSDAASEAVRAAREALVDALFQVGDAGDFLSADSLGYPEFLSLLQTTVGNMRGINRMEHAGAKVLVCNLPGAESRRSDCCMILGCNDGKFPGFARPQPSFMGYGGQVDHSMIRSRHRSTLYRVIRNHKRVLLWTPEMIGQEETLPSQFIEELVTAGLALEVSLQELLVNLKAPETGAAHRYTADLVESLSGLRLGREELNRFVQRGQLAHNIAQGMSVMAARSDQNLSEHDGIITDPQLLEWLKTWSDRHIYSVSQLDAVVTCTFRFFADRMLNLEELDESDDLLPSHIFGSFAHDVLARFYRGWVAEGRGVPKSSDEPLARKQLHEAFERESENFSDLTTFAHDLLELKLFGEAGPTGFAEGERELGDYSDPGILGQFLIMEMKRGDESAFDFLQPSNFEVGFGVGLMDEDDPLSVPDSLELGLGDGEHVKLRGRIDRIDISPTNVYAVTDYKTGRLPRKRDILAGFQTQLPIYVMVVEKLLADKYPGATPAGGLYYSLRRSETDQKVSGVFFRSAYHKQAGISARSSISDDDFEATMDNVAGLMRNSLKAVRTGFLTTTRYDPQSVCTFCAFESLCYRDVDRTAAFWESRESAAGTTDK